MTCVTQALGHLISIELAAGDQLEQQERGAIERVVAGARQRGGESVDLSIERSAAICI